MKKVFASKCSILWLLALCPAACRGQRQSLSATCWGQGSEGGRQLGAAGRRVRLENPSLRGMWRWREQREVRGGINKCGGDVV